MSLVLDTHVWLWLLQGSERLGSMARALIENGIRQAPVIVCAVTPWEIALLVAKGRISFKSDVRDWIEQQFARPGFTLHPLSIAVAVESTRLPGEPHGDPADRLIIATARHVGLPLVTADRTILTYAAAGHLNAIDAER